MDQVAPSPEGRPARVSPAAVGVLLGLGVALVAALALLTSYFNRLQDAAHNLPRIPALGSYQGRPEPVLIEGRAPANYLLMTADDDGELEAAVIAHLSASNRRLTLIALPAELIVDGQTLAAAYSTEPLQAARAVESLTGARMDHQVHIRVSGIGVLAEHLGGIRVGDRQLVAGEVVGFLDRRANGDRAPEHIAKAFQGLLQGLASGSAIADPGRFDTLLDVATECISVDSDLTPQAIEDVVVGSRVRADEIRTWALPTVPVSAGRSPEPVALQGLRNALGVDDPSLLP